MAVQGKGPGLFFRFQSGAPLLRELPVKHSLKIKGYEVNMYAGHSFHISTATTAAAVGMEDSVIKTLGRWESTAYLAYVRRSTWQQCPGDWLAQTTVLWYFVC